MKIFSFATTIASMSALVIPAVVHASSKKSKKSTTDMYKLTVKNLTFKQPMSGVFWVVHQCDIADGLFDFGYPASWELAELAESGSTAGVTAKFSPAGNPDVCSCGTGGGVGPSSNTDIIIPMGDGCDCISIATMMVNTNDAFVAVNGMLASDLMSMGAYLPALDAGSEKNDELCANIPGPACDPSGSGHDDDAEGYVHVHRGISGVGDLAKEVYMWLNPSAAVSLSPYYG